MKISLKLLTISAIISAATNSHAAPDLMGLKLGMTEAEVVNVIKTHNPKMTIEKTSSAFSSTPSFLRKIYAHTSNIVPVNGSELDAFIIDFAGGPNQSIAMKIERNVSLRYTTPTTADKLISAMQGKYGKEASGYNDGRRINFSWAYDAKKPCKSVERFVGIFHESSESAWRNVNNLKTGSAAIQDTSACGIVLILETIASPTGIIDSYKYTIMDAGGFEKNMYAQQKWVKSLTDDANNKIKGTATTPKI